VSSTAPAPVHRAGDRERPARGRCLLAVCDTPEPEVVAEFGDFVSWFGDPLRSLANLVVVDPRETPITQSVLDEVDSIVITGSRAAAYSDEPWVDALHSVVREAVMERHLPLLGVCFGHQVLARALGGAVAPNPRGLELGTIEVTLNDAGRESALFAAIPPRFHVQTLHGDTVSELPVGAKLLGSSPGDDHQAFAIGSAFGVQFHPEVRAEMLVLFLQMNGPRLRDRGLDPDVLRGALRPTPSGAQILMNFARFANGAR
jgi:GMP synthase (glutamine-hydrolysing)